jgi:hypothetical protein
MGPMLDVIEAKDVVVKECSTTVALSLWDTLVILAIRVKQHLLHAIQQFPVTR